MRGLGTALFGFVVELPLSICGSFSWYAYSCRRFEGSPFRDRASGDKLDGLYYFFKSTPLNKLIISYHAMLFCLSPAGGAPPHRHFQVEQWVVGVSRLWGTSTRRAWPWHPNRSLLPILKYQAALSSSIVMAQENPAISLAIAVFVTFTFFPLAIKYWYRAQSRHFAFHEISMTFLGKSSCRFRIILLFLAKNRYAWAASTKALRTCLFPVFVIDPFLTFSPLECSEGTRPRKAMSFPGVSKRVRSQSWEAIVAATIREIPRMAWRDLINSCRLLWRDWRRICSVNRWTRLIQSVTVSIYSWSTNTWAECGNATEDSQLKWVFVHIVFPGKTMSCRSRKAPSCCIATRSARVASIRARTKSRKASSSGVGTYTGVSSPARCNLA